MTMQENRSLPDLMRDIVTDAKDLIRGEFALARNETSEKLNRLVLALVGIFGGILVAFSALNILLLAVVELLTRYMPQWQAALIVGVVVAIIGLILVRQGAQALKPENFTPRRTADSLNRDAQLVKDRAR